MKSRYIPLVVVAACIPVGIVLGFAYPFIGGSLLGIGLLGSSVGIYDLMQKKTAVLKNYPVVARLRFLFESIRPEIRQYLLESDHEEVPYSREQRALIYRRAKGIEGLRPLGTLKNVQQIGYEWINHSIATSHVDSDDFRVTVGADHASLPYESSILNISGMSFGALSPNAIEALNKGAETGHFAHTTGEGSISRFHTKHNGDLVWQIGSGYFGCRDQHGNFDPEQFAKQARLDQVKMIEIKLSQGAKPGHGGILLGSKVTRDIAEARGIPMGEDCISPSSHNAFSSPLELVQFIERLRNLSGGKPVGIKLCIGHPWEFFSIAKAMHETGLHPDFITIDGAEGGTGASPVEFTDHVGAPLREGLMLAHNTLVGLDLRSSVVLQVSGKLVTAFDMARVFALGADICNMARGFMFAVGCIQAQSCHTGRCPTGVATQDPSRYKALVVEEKYKRVAKFHDNTLHALKELTEACGLSHPRQFTPHHLMMRISSREVRSAYSQYKWLEPGELLCGTSQHPAFSKFWPGARTDTFASSAVGLAQQSGTSAEANVLPYRNYM